MRLVQVTIPTGKRENVTAVLDDADIGYTLAEEVSEREYAAIAYIPLPTQAVEPVLETLRNAGIDESTYTVVLDAQTVVSRDFEALEERYAEEEDTRRIAREELVAAAQDLVPTLPHYVVLTVVSAVIATAGLLLDSPAVVVGSMVIAPLIGPALTASVGTVVVDEEMFTRAVKLQALGVLLSIASAAAFAWFVRTVHLVPPFTEVTEIPEIRERLAPDFLSLVVAVGAGIAGSLSLTAGVSSALVGVMIAVALIPPAATVGIGLAWGRPMASVGSSVLVLVNLLSINLAALVVLWYSGYRPTRWFQFDEARGATLRRVGILVVAILALSAFLGGVTYHSFQTANTDEQIQTAVNGTVSDTTGARLLEIEVLRSSELLFGDAQTVVVTVGVTGEDPPALAGPIDTEIERVTGREIETEVRFVRVETA